MLSPTQRDLYRTRGFSLAANLLAAGEVAMLAEECERLWRRIDPRHPAVQTRAHERLGRVPDRIDGAGLLSPILHALAADARLTGLAADAVGEPVVLFKDKLITKAPGTGGYGLHQDWPYWRPYGAAPEKMVSLMIAIDRSDAERGAIEIWPDALRAFPAPVDEPLDVDPAAIDMTKGELVAMAPGDILLLHPMAPHRSATNRSNAPRRAYFATYVAQSHAQAAEQRIAADRRRFFAA